MIYSHVNLFHIHLTLFSDVSSYIRIPDNDRFFYFMEQAFYQCDESKFPTGIGKSSANNRNTL